MRFSQRCRALAGSSITVISLVHAAPIAAQVEVRQPAPPRGYNIDGNGVDLVTGKYNVSSVDLTIGNGETGLTFSRNLRTAGYDDPYDTAMVGLTVTIGLTSDTFATTNSTSTAGTGATLTVSGSDYIYTMNDGTKYLFSRSVRSDYFRVASYRTTKITYPSGKIVTLEYDVAATSSTNQVSRVKAVQSSDGYRLVMRYQSDTIQGTSTSPIYKGYMTLSSVMALNSTADYCTASSCSFSNNAWRSVSYSWNPASTQETRTDPAGRPTVTTVNAAGQITGIRPPGAGSDRVQITYLADGRVSRFGTSRGAWLYSYSDAGDVRTTIVTSPTGLVHYVTSSIAKGKVLTDRIGSNGATSYEYDSRSRLTRITAPELNYTTFTYDGRDNVLSTATFSKDGSQSNVVDAAFVATCTNVVTCNKPIAVTDARRAVTNIEYDPTHGGVTRVIRPAPASGLPRPETRLSYAPYQTSYYGPGASVITGPAIWKLISMSECSSGEAATCVGTSAETKLDVAYPSGQLRNPLPASVTVKAGDNSVSRTTSRSYDVYGNAISISAPLAGGSFFSYDAARAVVEERLADPDGAGASGSQTTQYVRDAEGRPSQTKIGYYAQNNDGSSGPFVTVKTLETGYDVATGAKRSDRVVVNGQVKRLTQYNYDNDNRLTCAAVRVSPTGDEDACQQLSNATGYDSVTSISYGTNGKPSQIINGLELAKYNYARGDNGQLKSITDGNNNTTAFGYDSFDRLNRVTFPNPSGGDYLETGFDANGNVISQRQRDGRLITYTFDALNRPIRKVIPDGCAPLQVGACSPASATRDAFFGYDLQGRLKYARFDSDGGEGVSAIYNALGDLKSTTSTMGGVSRTLAYEYDAAGNRTRITHPDTVYFQNSYNGLGQITNAAWWAPNTGLVPFLAVEMDNLGQPTKITRANSRTEFGFDALSQLSSQSQRFSSAGADLTKSFTYNLLGQAISQTSSNDDFAYKEIVAVSRSYTVNALNQYATAGSASFAYDRNGNLVGDGSNTFVYDAENRLVSSSGQRSAQLVYDPLGRLVQTTGGAAGTTQFLYDGDKLVAEYNGSGGLLRRYMHGLGADDPQLWVEGAAMGCSASRFLHADERGSVVAAADCGGSRTNVNSYDEHGIPGAANVGRFQYTGQAWIPELGMYYYKARMYSPTLGRFLQTDPIGFDGGLNLYAYVGGDPVNHTDPTGLAAVVTPGGSGCATIALDTFNQCDINVGGGGGGGGGGGYYPSFGFFFPSNGGLGLVRGGGGGSGRGSTAAPALPLPPQNDPPPICTRGQLVAQAIGNRAMQVGRKATQLGDKAALGGTLAAAGSAALLNPAGVLVGGLVADAGVMVSVAGRLQIAGGAALSVLGGRSIRSTGAQVITDWLPFSDYYKDTADRAVNTALDWVGVPDRPGCRKQ